MCEVKHFLISVIFHITKYNEVANLIAKTFVNVKFYKLCDFDIIL